MPTDLTPNFTKTCTSYCSQRKDGSLTHTLACDIARRQAKAEQGRWIPANQETETPFTTRTGKVLLYCYQPSTGRHAYLDCGTDIILTDEEAQYALGM